MATLMTRIDHTKEHLWAESHALVARTREAGDGLATAVRDELVGWQGYVETRRVALGRELRTLASPAGVQLAALKAADELLTRTHATVHARIEALESTMRKARRSRTAPKTAAKPAAKRAATGAKKKGVVFAAAQAA